MNHIIINKGHDIRISGIPGHEVISGPNPEVLSILPNLFRGVKPKLMVKEGDNVKIGSPLFFDKIKPDVRWASPGSGKISQIQFGARRAIEKIEVTVNNNPNWKGEEEKKLNGKENRFMYVKEDISQ